MIRQGILIVVSGFSGAGKGTVMKSLTDRYDSYALSVSATTRHPRPGEAEGKAYFFKTRDEFEQMIADGSLIEYAQYVDNYYGTPRAYVEQQLSEGRDVILEIEIQGARKVRETVPRSSAAVCDGKRSAHSSQPSDGKRDRNAGGGCPETSQSGAGGRRNRGV